MLDIILDLQDIIVAFLEEIVGCSRIYQNSKELVDIQVIGLLTLPLHLLNQRTDRNVLDMVRLENFVELSFRLLASCLSPLRRKVIFTPSFEQSGQPLLLDVLTESFEECVVTFFVLAEVVSSVVLFKVVLTGLYNSFL